MCGWPCLRLIITHIGSVTRNIQLVSSLLLRSEHMTVRLSMIRQVGKVSSTASWAFPGKSGYTFCRS